MQYITFSLFISAKINNVKTYHCNIEIVNTYIIKALCIRNLMFYSKFKNNNFI